MILFVGKVNELAGIQGLTYIVVVCFVSCCIGGLGFLKSYIHILLVVSGVFVLGYIKGKIWRKTVVVYSIFERM